MDNGRSGWTGPDVGFDTSRVGETDAGLLARCGADPECLGHLFDRHADPIHRYLARRVGPGDADDLLSEVFLVAYEARARCDQSRPDARPWLYGIAADLSARQFRSRTRAAAAAAELAISEPSPSPSRSEVDHLDAERSWPRIAAALEEIPDDQRDALLLHAWEDLSHDDIAVALDIPVGSVRSRIHRARARLRDSSPGSGKAPPGRMGDVTTADELQWLRNAAPPTDGPSDLARRGARRRVLEGPDRTSAARDDARLDTLPVDGLPVAPVDEDPTEPDGRNRNRRVVIGAAAALLLLIVAATVFGGGGDEGADDETANEATAPSTAPPATTAPADAGERVPVISVDTEPVPGGLITVTVAREPGEPAPWPLFELCGTSPRGCMPIWTDDLRLGESTATADLTVPLWFDAPDGTLHDCTRDECELRVTALTATASFPLEGGAEEPATTPSSPGPAPTVGLVPDADLVDGEEVRVDIGRMPDGRRAEVWMCPPAGRGTCDLVGRVGPDETGAGSLTLRLPRLITAFSPESGRWQFHDCAIERCRLEVRGGGLVGETTLSFDPSSRRLPPVVDTTSAGPFEPGDWFTLTGRRFLRSSTSTPTRVRWVLCERAPTEFNDLTAWCGTPRTINFTTLDQNGAFDLAVLVPEPETVLAWDDGHALDCTDPCYLMVLTDPFPSIVGVPLRIG